MEFPRKALLKFCKAIKDNNIQVYEKYKHSIWLRPILSQGYHETECVVEGIIEFRGHLGPGIQGFCLQHFAIENSTRVLGQEMCPFSTSPLLDHGSGSSDPGIPWLDHPRWNLLPQVCSTEGPHGGYVHLQSERGFGGWLFGQGWDSIRTCRLRSTNTCASGPSGYKAESGVAQKGAWPQAFFFFYSCFSPANIRNRSA